MAVEKKEQDIYQASAFSGEHNLGVDNEGCMDFHVFCVMTELCVTDKRSAVFHGCATVTVMHNV